MPEKPESFENKNNYEDSKYQEFADRVESRKNIKFGQLTRDARSSFSSLCDKLGEYVISKEEKSAEREETKEDKQTEASRED